jgi:hypothetical protein
VGEKILSPKVIHKVPEKAELKSNRYVQTNEVETRVWEGGERRMVKPLELQRALILNF